MMLRMLCALAWLAAMAAVAWLGLVGGWRR